MSGTPVAIAGIHPDRKVRMRDGFRFCVVVFVSLRLVVSLLGVVGVQVGPGEGIRRDEVWARQALPAAPGLHNAFDGTDRWDAAWFLHIAEEGYSVGDPSAAFFPAYPGTIRILAFLTMGNTLAAALLVSNLSFLGALVVLYALTTREFSETVARRTVIWAAVFPTSFFFLAPYSESFFLLAVLLTFWFAREGLWTRAALAGSLAAGTRSIGIVLVPALLAELVSRRDREGIRASSIVAALVPAVGPVLYLVGWGLLGGHPFAPFDAQAHWARELALAPVTLVRGLVLGLQGLSHARGLYWFSDLALTSVVIVALWRVVRRGLSASYVVFAVASLATPLSYPFPPRPLLSLPRFALTMFPMFWGLALLTERRSRLAIAGSVSAIALGVHAILFMNWLEVI